MPDNAGSDTVQKPSGPNAFIDLLFENMDDPEIQIEFSNRVVAIVQDSNILLYFGVDKPRGGDRYASDLATKYSTCISMSHAYFMQTIEYLAVRYSALKEMFGDSPLTAGQAQSLDPERFKRAIEILNGPVIPSAVDKVGGG